MYVTVVIYKKVLTQPFCLSQIFFVRNLIIDIGYSSSLLINIFTSSNVCETFYFIRNISPVKLFRRILDNASIRLIRLHSPFIWQRSPRCRERFHGLRYILWTELWSLILNPLQVSNILCTTHVIYTSVY